MSWTNLSIEAFCFGDEKDGNYPCGRDCPSSLCLENNMCPHLGYSNTTEREVAQFTPLRLILKDRIGIIADDIYWKLRWWFWDRLPFNMRKMEEFFDSIKTVSSEEYTALTEWEDEEKQNDIDFKEWFTKVTNEDR